MHDTPLWSRLGRLRSLTFTSVFVVILCAGLAAPGVASADQGYATWYGAPFQGNVMANGQIYNMYDPTTTACNIFPLGTWIKVTNPANGRSVVVQVRDTGAFTHALDLSYAAFKLIGDPSLMEIPVEYQVVSGPAGNPVSAPTPAPSRATPSSRGGRPAANRSSTETYVVQPGDTVSSIATRFNVDSANLARWNQLSNPNSISIGSTLLLSASAADVKPAATASRTYVVQNGDTLSGIALQFGVDQGQLAAANNLSDPFPITVGQTLTVPDAGSGAVTSSPTRTYVVQVGDTLDGIATKFGITPDSLTAANSLGDPNMIQPGTSLTIPAS